MNAHSVSSSGPGLARITSGIATLPTSCSSAASRTSATSASGSPRRRATASARSATSLECGSRSGWRSDSARQSTSLVWLVADGRPPCLWAYIRWSASRSAASAESASSGTRTEPNEQPTANPSPRSVSAAPAFAIVAADITVARRGDDAELVAAEAVRLAASCPSTARSQRRAEPREQRVAGRVAERVVVLLEAVEVEDAEHDLGARPLGEDVLEIGHERTAVAQAREPVDERLAPARAQHPEILVVRHRQPDEHRDEGGRREPEREQVDLREVVVHEQHQADRREHERQTDRSPALPVAGAGARRGQPRGPGDDDRGERPARIEEPPVAVAPDGVRVDVQRVADREDREARCDPRPSAVQPPRHRDRAPDEAEQQQVAERIGEVRRDAGRRPRQRVGQRVVEQGRAERRERERADRAVDPQGSPVRAAAGAVQQDEAGERERVQRQVADVGG